MSQAGRVASGRVLKCVLHNFLGTLASRHSDFRGYWLFGQHPAELDRWKVDLRGAATAGDEPLGFAMRLAILRFEEQLAKAGLGMSVVREAMLSCVRVEPALGLQGGCEVRGHCVELRVRVVTDRGRLVEHHHTMFVAPHDPSRERRRHT